MGNIRYRSGGDRDIDALRIYTLGEKLNTDLVMRVIGIAMTVAVSCMILSRCGREDQASLVSLAGIVTALIVLFTEIASLFDTVRSIFGF